MDEYKKNSRRNENREKISKILGIAFISYYVIFSLFTVTCCSGPEQKPKTKKEKHSITFKDLECIQTESSLVFVMMNDFESVNCNESKVALAGPLKEKIGSVYSKTSIMGDTVISNTLTDALINSAQLQEFLENRIILSHLDTTGVYKPIFDSVCAEKYVTVKLKYVEAYTRIMNYKIDVDW